MATKRSSPSGRSETRSETRADTVSFDFKRDLINILGEEHYPFGEYLYHELAANAWDEDATEVHIIEEATQVPGPRRAGRYEIIVRDNGNGMDYEKLLEYFGVGGSAKRERKSSERFGRPLIGRIGVGKVSILKVARRWTITSERHLGLREPVRLTVDVDIDEWIGGSPGFDVEYLTPEGRPETEIVLHDVQTKLRDDRILRHLQRLPLGDEFMIWRNGQLIPPKRWYGIHKVDIDTIARWQQNGDIKEGPIRGEIWIRQPSKNKREQAYLKEPATEKEGLDREPAGIEVRVNRDVITREFFGHEAHGHQVNRLWGWVDVDWLPILGNRTDYLRDHPAGRAFYDTVKPIFTEVYNATVRYERDTRAQQSPTKKVSSPHAEEYARATQEAAAVRQEDVPEKPERASWVSRYGEGVSQFLTDHPEFAPVVEQPARTSRGRPANDRIYPVRASGERRPFDPDQSGNDIAITTERQVGRTRSVVTGNALRSRSTAAEESDLGEIINNTTAGVRLRFIPLGALEAPYRWNLEQLDDLTLDVNTDAKLYPATSRPGSQPHRLYAAWVVALALAERASPSAGRWLSDFLETVSYELFARWETRAGS